MLGLEGDVSQIAQLIGVLMGAGIVAGFAAGLFGIGGGFVIVPALLVVFGFFGVDADVLTHVAIGTSLATIIVTSSRSVFAHNQRGAVDIQIIKDWAPWLVLGVAGGLFLAQFMDGRSLKWVFSTGVFLMGLHFIMPVLKDVRLTEEMPKGAVRAGLASFLGGFSALLGIGGGTIAILTMTMCGRPFHQAVGTASGFGVIIAIPGAIGFVLLGMSATDLPIGSVGYVNLLAVMAIAAMSFITAPLGARAAHSLNGPLLKRIFGVYLVATSAVVLWNSLL